MFLCATTVIPDIFREDPWPEKPLDDEFKAWLGKQSIDRVHSDIEVAVEALRDRGFGKPLGLVGFCFGGARVMDQIGMVEDGVDPEAAAAFYPVGKSPCALCHQHSSVQLNSIIVSGTTDFFFK